MKYKSIIIVAVVVLVVVLATWYFYYAPSRQSYTSQPTISQQPNLSSGDTTKNIANDLNQTPGDSAATQEMNSLDQNLKNF